MTAGESLALDCLNNAERDVLTLLAQGHTAKSIAALRGVTTAAVNERLRSARRKTGVGSSRELARLVTAQENRDDFIGLAAPPLTSSPSIRPDASPQRRASFFRRWRLPMTAAATIAAAIFLAQLTAAPSLPATTGRGGGVVSDIISHEARENEEQQKILSALHSEATSLPDPQWSSAAEARLARRYQEILRHTDDIDSFDVTCSATLCEAVGTTRLAVSGNNIVELMSQLHDAASIQKGLEGFRREMWRYGSNPAKPGTFMFVAYWRRT